MVYLSRISSDTSVLLLACQNLIGPVTFVLAAIGYFDDCPDKTIDVTLGRPTTLVCPPRNADGFGAVYQWRKFFSGAQVTFDPNDRRVMTPEGNMYIINVTSEDVQSIRLVGGFQCRISAANVYDDSCSVNVREVGKGWCTAVVTTEHFTSLSPSTSPQAWYGIHDLVNCQAGRNVDWKDICWLWLMIQMTWSIMFYSLVLLTVCNENNIVILQCKVPARFCKLAEKMYTAH